LSFPYREALNQRNKKSRKKKSRKKTRYTNPPPKNVSLVIFFFLILFLVLLNSPWRETPQNALKKKMYVIFPFYFFCRPLLEEHRSRSSCWPLCALLAPDTSWGPPPVPRPGLFRPHGIFGNAVGAKLYIADTWVFDMEKGKRAGFRQKHFNGLFVFFELELPSPPPPTEKRPKMH
jgi:hypothetical protein